MQSIEDIYTRYQYYNTLSIIAIIVSLVLLILLLTNWFIKYVINDFISKEEYEFAQRLDTFLLTCVVVAVPISLAIFYSHECLYKEIVTACSKQDHELCTSVPVRNKVGRKVC